MTIPVPTLSVAGWVRSPAEKADYLLSHFFETQKNQTFIYEGSVESLQSLLALNSRSITEALTAIADYLRKYLSVYYESVKLEIRSNEDEVQDGKVTLTISTTVVDDGVTYSLGHLVETLDSKFQKISRMNNEGNVS